MEKNLLIFRFDRFDRNRIRCGDVPVEQRHQVLFIGKGLRLPVWQRLQRTTQRP